MKPSKHKLNNAKMKLIADLILENPDITPVCGGKDLSECFTDEDDESILWYNTADHSTHVKRIKYSEVV